MKINIHSKRAVSATLLLGLTALAQGQGFDFGSNGSRGALTVTESSMTVDLPPDGRLHYTTVNVPAGRTLRFTRNALNTPVYLLAQGDVVINGSIDISGSPAPGSPPIGGVGGPGGFDGGKPGFGSLPPGDGYGPGGGGGGITGSAAESAGGASYGQLSTGGSSERRGVVYGSPLLIPLLGGSGGGGDTGTPGSGGGGGGGAILIASNTKIQLTGRIEAQGGNWRGTSHNAGSGGAIRLLSPRVEGSGVVNVNGGSSGGGAGRIRVDCIDKGGLQLNFQPLSSTTVGANMFVDPGVVPQLTITQAAGQNIPANSSSTVRIQLPFGSDTNRTVTLQARDFGTDVPVRVAFTPDSGPRIVVDTNIVNTTVNPASVVVPVGLPPNTLVTVHAWTR